MELIFDLWPVKCPRSWFMYSCSCCVHLGYGSGFSPWAFAVVVSLGCCAEWNQAAKPQVHLLPDPLHCSCGTADPEARYWNFLRVSLRGWKTKPWAVLISSPALCSFTELCILGKRRGGMGSSAMSLRAKAFCRSWAVLLARNTTVQSSFHLLLSMVGVDWERCPPPR